LKFNNAIENAKFKSSKRLKLANNMDLDTYFILKNYKITSSYGMFNIKIKKYILFKFNIQFQHILSAMRTLKGNKIYNFYSYKFNKEKGKVSILKNIELNLIYLF